MNLLLIVFVLIVIIVSANQNPFDVAKLDPSCEKLWNQKFPDGKNPEFFQYPSDLILYNTSVFSSRPEWTNRVYCIPTKLIRFTQNSISAHTSSGESLDEWIDTFKKHNSYHKKNLPDVINWGNGYFTSLDNRRVYCARKAEIVFVPARIYAPQDNLVQDYDSRFKIRVQGYYFNGTQIAKTYGEAAAFRSISTGQDFSMFGELDLPKVTGPRNEFEEEL
jgi:hypothetical protein